MDANQTTSALFPVSHCASCERTVLTYLVLDARGEDARCCVHCEARVEGGIAWVGAAELEADGYVIGTPAAHKAGFGCGSGGCGSCASRRN
jgi:hypothetical protein